jgi:phosphoribosylformylglycinamidine cyclo-ligase
MPGFYKDKEYDVAGFIVGIVDQEKIIDGKNIQPGDLLMGLPSNGLHTNGYSLVRHIIFEQLKLSVDSKAGSLPHTIGEELLRVHKSYLKPVTQLINQDLIKGMAHITGGGFIDNIPRILPNNVSVQIQRVWPVPEIFNFLCDKGKISKAERFRVFNMGIGMVLIFDKKNLSKVENVLNNLDETGYLIGQVVEKKDKERIKIN